jgi:carbonic anhydrase
MKKLLLISSFAAISMAALALDPTPKSVAPKVALERLANGNARFVAGKAVHPDQSVKRRTESAKGQAPFASVLSCADSRLSPELIFDQGIGNLFVVRVAGNTAEPVGIGSLEYSVAVLGSRTVVVMGHEKCGAVAAAVKGGELPGSIGAVTKAIEPAVAEVKGKSGDPVKLATTQNVRDTVKKIRQQSSIISDLEKKGELKIVGAEYTLADGKVKFFEVK